MKGDFMIQDWICPCCGDIATTVTYDPGNAQLPSDLTTLPCRSCGGTMLLKLS